MAVVALCLVEVAAEVAIVVAATNWEEAVAHSEQAADLAMNEAQLDSDLSQLVFNLEQQVADHFEQAGHLLVAKCHHSQLTFL